MYVVVSAKFLIESGTSNVKNKLIAPLMIISKPAPKSSDITTKADISKLAAEIMPIAINTFIRLLILDICSFIAYITYTFLLIDGYIVPPPKKLSIVLHKKGEMVLALFRVDFVVMGQINFGTWRKLLGQP